MTDYTSLKIIEDEFGTEFTDRTDPSLKAIQRYIAEAEDLIDDYAGRSFKTTVVEDEVRDFDGASHISFPAGFTSVEKIEYRLPPETDWVELEGTDFVVYPEFGWVERSRETARNWPVRGQKTLRVSYTVGDDNNIPRHVRQLATDIVVTRVLRKAMQQEAQVVGGEIQVGPIRLQGSPQSLVERISRLEDSVDMRLRELANTKAYTAPEKNWY